MDDTNWITSSKDQTEEVLVISHDFYSFNNILVNDNKAVLMTSTVKTACDPNNAGEFIALPIYFDAGANRSVPDGSIRDMA